MIAHELETHPVSEMFPMMNDDEYERFCDDIKEHGLREPIMIFRDMIIDGRNRYRACRDLNVEPDYREWTGDESDILDYIISLNLHRRHLSASQRAMIAAKLATLGEGRPRKTASIEAVSQREAAEKMEVGRSSVQRAKKVKERGTDALQEAVVNGSIAVSVAELISQAPAEEQDEIVARGEDEIMKASRRIRRQNKEKRDRQRQKEIEEEIRKAQSRPLSESMKLYTGDFREVIKEQSISKVDVIITDPPYAQEYLPLYEDLAKVAAEILRPGGLCIVMTGQSWLPEIMEMMTKHLTYRWTGAFLTGQRHVPVFARQINSGWKPIAILSNGKPAEKYQMVYDVFRSRASDKDHHEWEQSVDGMEKLVEAFSAPGQLVVDPFCGSGTTGVAALKLGRKFIGIDIEESSIEASHTRLVA